VRVISAESRKLLIEHMCEVIQRVISTGQKIDLYIPAQCYPMSMGDQEGAFYAAQRICNASGRVSRQFRSDGDCIFPRGADAAQLADRRALRLEKERAAEVVRVEKEAARHLRDQEIRQRIACGHSVVDVAEQLGISSQTVRNVSGVRRQRHFELSFAHDLEDIQEMLLRIDRPKTAAERNSLCG